jgi:hypothetical protein
MRCSQGGPDEPGNYLLLCSYCHEEQPDEATRDVQEEWLEEREYCHDRHVRKTRALFARLEKLCSDQDRLKAFWGFFVRRPIGKKLWARAERETGRISKRSEIHEDLMVALLSRWLRRTRGADSEKIRVRGSFDFLRKLVESNI